MTTGMPESVASCDSICVRWERDLLNVAEAFAMDESERARFAAKPIARLIAALPYLAGCERPERTAIEHLGVHVLSVRSTRCAFFASPDDDRDVFARLEPIMRFRGVDRVLGKYNPIAAGTWDADAMAGALRRRVAEIDCPEMDEIMSSTEGDEGADDWWSWE